MSEPIPGVLFHGAAPSAPSEKEVDDLIAAASAHPLGVRFLVEGHLGSVATTFRTHAFTVDAARERLRKRLRERLPHEEHQPGGTGSR
jgi:hypothetical protein